MVAWNFGPTWAERTRRHGTGSVRPITATILEERAKAFRIATATRTAWLPKRLVKHDPEKGVFHVPSWLCEQKLLD